jgi:hypothetical protein
MGSMVGMGDMGGMGGSGGNGRSGFTHTANNPAPGVFKPGYSDAMGSPPWYADPVALASGTIGGKIAGAGPLSPGGPLFRPGGLLNTNRYLRIGVGRHEGRAWFRLSGNVIKPFNPHGHWRIKDLGPWGRPR